MAGGKMKTKESKPKKRNPNSVLRRNARERDRIRNVNDAFDDLRNHVPNGECVKGRKISKVETLKSAIEYIHALRDILGDSVQPIDLSDLTDGADEQTAGDPSSSPHSPESETGQHEKWSADQRSNTSSNEIDGEQDLRGLLESSSRSLTESPESEIHSNETSMDLTNSKPPGPIESMVFGQNPFESVGGLTGFLNDPTSSPQTSPTEVTGLSNSLRSVLEQTHEPNHFRETPTGYQNDAIGLYQNTMNTLGSIENSPALDPSEINQNIMKTEPWNQSICDNNSFATINATVNFENYDFTLLQSQFASNQGTVNGPSSASGPNYSSLQFEF